MSDVKTKNADEKFCESCGNVIKKEAEICPKCGVRQKSIKNTLSVEPSEKNRLVAFLLCTFLGLLGIHRFYAGKVVSGIMQILFGWATFFIWNLVDWIMILSGTFRDIDGRRIVNWKNMENQNITKKESKGLIVFLWILSIFVMFIGFIILFTYPIVGISWFLIGLILLPPLAKIVKEKLKINKIVKTIIIIVLFIISLFGVLENKYNKADEYYQEANFSEAIKKIDEINPKNDMEEKKLSDLIELYSNEKKLYEADKNKYYNDKGIKYYNDKGIKYYNDKDYEKAILILSKIEKESEYFKNSNLLVTKYNNEKQKEEDKNNYEEAKKLFENGEYDEALVYIDNISNKFDYYNLGKVLKNKVNNKISEDLKKIEKQKKRKKELDSAKKRALYKKIGQTFKTEKFEIKVISVKIKKNVGGQYFNQSVSKGAIYVAVVYQYKNISNKPVGAFSVPSLKLVDSNDIKYKVDIGASSYYATEINIDSKIFSDINPGITIKDSAVFEISSDHWNKRNWRLDIDESWENYPVLIK